MYKYLHELKYRIQQQKKTKKNEECNDLHFIESFGLLNQLVEELRLLLSDSVKSKLCNTNPDDSCFIKQSRIKSLIN